MSRPTLTRKDFERIASTLADLRAVVATLSTEIPERQERMASQAFDSATTDIARVLCKSNAAFDPVRFCTMAGVKK
jgi:hypothetical protein